MFEGNRKNVKPKNFRILKKRTKNLICIINVTENIVFNLTKYDKIYTYILR
jgi:hypothetical protein